MKAVKTKIASRRKQLQMSGYGFGYSHNSQKVSNTIIYPKQWYDKNIKILQTYFSRGYSLLSRVPKNNVQITWNINSITTSIDRTLKNMIKSSE